MIITCLDYGWLRREHHLYAFVFFKVGVHDLHDPVPLALSRGQL